MSIDVIRNFERTDLEAGILIRLMYRTPPEVPRLADVAIGVQKHINNSPYFKVRGGLLDGRRQRLAIDVEVVSIPSQIGSANLDLMLSTNKTVSTSLGPFGVMRASFISSDELSDLSRSKSMGVGSVSIFVDEPTDVRPEDFLTDIENELLPLIMLVGDGLSVVRAKVGDVVEDIKDAATSPLALLFIFALLAIGGIIAVRVVKDTLA